jgi:hypothetical protein
MSTLTLNVQSAENGFVAYTVNTGKKVYERQTKRDGLFTHDGIAYQYDAETRSISQILENAIQAKPLKPMKSEFSINQRFSFLEKFTGMVVDGTTASAIVTGEGGLGKTHSVLKVLEDAGLEEVFGETVEAEDEDGEAVTIAQGDYKIIKGYSTPKALYATLYENRNKLVIFDDCDSVLRDPASLNILKGALDSYDRRTISWLSKGFIDDGLPSSFDFEGQVIFISNLSADKIDQAVKSRSICIDLSMSVDDKIERMQSILKDILPEFDMGIKKAALEFLDEHKYEAKELNMRTLQKVTKVAFTYGIDNPEWKLAAKYLLTNV